MQQAPQPPALLPAPMNLSDPRSRVTRARTQGVGETLINLSMPMDNKNFWVELRLFLSFDLCKQANKNDKLIIEHNKFSHFTFSQVKLSLCLISHAHYEDVWGVEAYLHHS
jgi:hypothetical protein